MCQMIHTTVQLNFTASACCFGWCTPQGSHIHAAQQLLTSNSNIISTKMIVYSEKIIVFMVKKNPQVDSSPLKMKIPKSHRNKSHKSQTNQKYHFVKVFYMAIVHWKWEKQDGTLLLLLTFFSHHNPTLKWSIRRCNLHFGVWAKIKCTKCNINWKKCRVRAHTFICFVNFFSLLSTAYCSVLTSLQPLYRHEKEIHDNTTHTHT